MRDLIERLERATGPNRELDALIMASFPDSMPDPRATMVPAYTGSLDAVLKLMPDGWMWDVSSSGCAWIMRDDDSFCDSQIVISGIGNPIIALCIAALKAREAAK